MSKENIGAGDGNGDNGLDFAQNVQERERRLALEAAQKGDHVRLQKQAELDTERQRVEAMKSDARFLQLRVMAHDPKLGAALDYLRKKFGGRGKKKIQEELQFFHVVEKMENHPVGWYVVLLTYQADETAGASLEIRFTYRDEEVKKKVNPSRRSIHGYFPAHSSGYDRPAGFAIEVVKDVGSRGIDPISIGGSLVFQTVDELIEYLTEEAAKGSGGGTSWEYVDRY